MAARSSTRDLIGAIQLVLRYWSKEHEEAKKLREIVDAFRSSFQFFEISAGPRFRGYSRADLDRARALSDAFFAMKEPTP